MLHHVYLSLFPSDYEVLLVCVNSFPGVWARRVHTVRLGIPACFPEAWLQGCLHLRVERYNFVWRETQRINVARLCFPPRSVSWENGHVRANYAIPNQTKWLLLVFYIYLLLPLASCCWCTCKQCNAFFPALWKWCSVWVIFQAKVLCIHLFLASQICHICFISWKC